jgi:DNA-nicking Smr family endonuclease
LNLLRYLGLYKGRIFRAELPFAFAVDKVLIMDKPIENFFDAVSDVKPLVKEDRVLLNHRAIDKATIVARQRSAQRSDPQPDPLVNADVAQVEATAVLGFQRPGVQHGVYKNLRLGKYAIEARLDLHGMTVEQARGLVYQFVRDCMANDIRCALLTHGKGEGRIHPAILKSYVAHWLPQMTEVLAFHSAQKHHGGTGASYIMLKKSDKKRQENLEKHQKSKTTHR